jgi:hypothetical protein
MFVVETQQDRFAVDPGEIGRIGLRRERSVGETEGHVVTQIPVARDHHEGQPLARKTALER